MTTAMVHGYFKDRYCGHPLSVLMMVILRPETLLTGEETISDMMVCPEPMTLIIGGDISKVKEGILF